MTWPHVSKCSAWHLLEQRLARRVELEGDHGYVWTIRDGVAVLFQWFQSHAEALSAAGVDEE